MRTPVIPLFTNKSFDVDGYSPAVNLADTTGFSIQAVWTGSPTATFVIQVSCDPDPTMKGTPTNWTLLDNSTVTGGAAGTHVWGSANAPYRWVRLGVVVGGGSGVLNAICSCKGHD